jgi:RNA polymerase sigma factor (sigma-70 family)
MYFLKEKIKNLNIKPILEEMVCDYQDNSDPETMAEIVKVTEKLVYKTISEFRNRGIDYNDLSQIGFTGLIGAINKFDKKLNNKFSTYAVHCIKGEVLHFLRDKNLVKYPRWIFEKTKIISDYIKDFEALNERFPTIEEISGGVSLSIKDIDEILKARNSIYNSESLDNNMEQKDIKLSAELLKSTYHKSFESVIEDRILLWDAIKKLSRLQKKIFISNFILGKTQQEIGKEIGLSQKTVSKNIKESLAILKKEIKD